MRWIRHWFFFYINGGTSIDIFIAAVSTIKRFWRSCAEWILTVEQSLLWMAVDLVRTSGLTDVWYANRTLGMNWSQLFPWSLTILLSDSLSVRLSRSRWPFVCGWYAYEMRWSVWNCSIRLSMIEFTNSRSWSLANQSVHTAKAQTTPYNKLRSTKLLSGTAVASVHLEKWSVAATIYIFCHLMFQGVRSYHTFPDSGILLSGGTSLLILGFMSKHFHILSHVSEPFQ